MKPGCGGGACDGTTRRVAGGGGGRNLRLRPSEETTPIGCDPSNVAHRYQRHNTGGDAFMASTGARNSGGGVPLADLAPEPGHDGFGGGTFIGCGDTPVRQLVASCPESGNKVMA